MIDSHRISKLEEDVSELTALVTELVYIVGNIGGIDVRKLSQMNTLKNLKNED